MPDIEKEIEHFLEEYDARQATSDADEQELDELLDALVEELKGYPDATETNDHNQA